jgi:cytochrome c oxidase subunit 4
MATQTHHASQAHSRHGDGHHGHDHHAEHAAHLRAYKFTFAALMILLVLTLAAAAINLGPFNLPIAMAIAVAKAVLVMVYFMHLKWSTLLVRVFAVTAFLWLIILFALTLADYIARPPDSLPYGTPHRASRPAVQVISYS